MVSALGFPEGGHFYWEGSGKAAQKTEFLRRSWKSSYGFQKLKQDIWEGIKAQRQLEVGSDQSVERRGYWRKGRLSETMRVKF